MTTSDGKMAFDAAFDDGDGLLMRLFDGESDDVAGEAEAPDQDQLEKLAGLALSEELLADAFEGDHFAAADGIADWVMTKIDADELVSVAELQDQGLESLEQQLNAPALRGASDKPAAEVIALPSKDAVALPKVAVPTHAPRAANENSRRIYGLAAAAAAVAAGLFFWGRSAEPELPLAHHATPPAAVAEADPVAAETKAPPGANADDSADTETEGVEIASVDFGRHNGSVFYVSGNGAAPSTAVVWVTDTGEDQ